MTTEYRQNIPSVAHVEAATRLGIEWHRESHRDPHNSGFFTRFRYVDGQLRSNYTEYSKLDDFLTPVSPAERTYSYRPIRPDGTPVDWEVLDQEVARMRRQGQPVTVTPTTSATPTTQPQGFRADLWRRICQHFISADEDRVSSRHFSDVETIERRGCLFRDGDGWQWLEDEGPTRTDILARWTVYQELKPLYDLVDGAQGEAAMPRDVLRECRTRASWPGEPGGRWSLRYSTRLEVVGLGEVWHGDGHTWFERANMRNFAAVLDAVAERRVAERQATAAEPTPSVSLLREQRAPTVTSQPEPRRFADVRPDRHGWRWWRVCNGSLVGSRFDSLNGDWRWLSSPSFEPTGHLANYSPWVRANLELWTSHTVIPTDEQGNPVSWDSIGPTDPTEVRLSSPQEGSALDFEQGVDRANRAISQALVAPLGPPPVGEMTRGLADYDGPVLTIDSVSCESASGWVTLSGLRDSMLALPRFGLIELDDDDRTGQSRQAPGPALRSGAVPTAAQVAKFRGVLSRKLDGTLADAVKESKISCEVSQHVLQRWAGGLGDEEAAEMIDLIVRFETSTKSAAEVDQHAQAILASWSPRFADLGSEPARPAPSRGEMEERRRRLAELQARLRAERAERPNEEPEEEPGRMALIEPDPAADPGASIRAWEERQEAARAAVRLRPDPATEREREPPRGPAVELVDASYLGSWLGRLYALASTDLPDTRLGARLGPRQRASG